MGLLRTSHIRVICQKDWLSTEFGGKGLQISTKWRMLMYGNFPKESVVDEGADGKGMNAMERAVNGPILCPKIIGRTPEFAALGSLVEQAKDGQGHIALITGEAGIGKSRLVSELKTTAMAQGFL